MSKNNVIELAGREAGDDPLTESGRDQVNEVK